MRDLISKQCAIDYYWKGLPESSRARVVSALPRDREEFSLYGSDQFITFRVRVPFNTRRLAE